MSCKQGVPWTCALCDDAHPTHFVHYDLVHSSLKDGKERRTFLACNEHLHEVIVQAASMQGHPEVVVASIAVREKWKNRTFGQHYGVDPQAKSPADHDIHFHLKYESYRLLQDKLRPPHVIYAIHLYPGDKPTQAQDVTIRRGIDQAIKDVLGSGCISIRTEDSVDV